MISNSIMIKPRKKILRKVINSSWLRPCTEEKHARTWLHPEGNRYSGKARGSHRLPSATIRSTQNVQNTHTQQRRMDIRLCYH